MVCPLFRCGERDYSMQRVWLRFVVTYPLAAALQGTGQRPLRGRDSTAACVTWAGASLDRVRILFLSQSTVHFVDCGNVRGKQSTGEEGTDVPRTCRSRWCRRRPPRRLT
jgi:hypothetical protein